jgi:large subunit ribosomal protein L4e
VNQNQRRYATCSAVAASALPALVMARGHVISDVAEIPCVVDDGIESIKKTSDAAALLEDLGALEDVNKSKKSRKVRTGRGKLRNRRHVQRRGPLIIYNSNEGIRSAFRNLPGVDLCDVNSLNLLQLAPGGHLGRFCIWSKGAFDKLDAIYGTGRAPSSTKKSYNLPRAIMANPDVNRLINSDEIQSVVNAAKEPSKKKTVTKHNPLKNLEALLRLNPYAKNVKETARKVNAANFAARQKK